jgi:hypothetical protein
MDRMTRLELSPTAKGITLGASPRQRLMFTGAGSGLYEPTQLGELAGVAGHPAQR